ncbi:MAG: PBP1A family penicillin-binding protein [Acidobacteria bacterium]|nr:PBP1A family penicillin-binding protein [Acidobacteriota bacterium]
MVRNAGNKSPTVQWKTARRVTKDTSRRRRLLRWLLIVGGLIGLVLVSSFAYFYAEATTNLDEWLQGAKRSVNSSNVYAAPKVLRLGQGIALSKVIDHLRLASYVESAQDAEPGRGIYRTAGQVLEVKPGSTAVLDHQRAFPHVYIKFDAKRQQIEQIIDAVTKRPLETCQLEPILISTITRSLGRESNGPERGVRYEVTYQQLPPHLVNAVLAIEDKSFFEHGGVSTIAILRAFWHNLQRGRPVEGGSTITQQLVKNIMVGPERSYQRKFREAFLAMALERRLTKEQIFAQYANTIYMGYRGGLSVYGLGAAAREYFNKDVSQLTLPEAALLAGMINRPAFYLSGENKEEALQRRNVVLDNMRELGFITAAEAATAKQAPLGLRFRSRPGDVEVNTPYFIDYVQEQVARFVPDTDLAKAGYRIYTTLDLDLQRASSIAVGEGLAVLDRSLRRMKPAAPPGSLQAAFVVLDTRTGEILAMVGGRSYSESQFNRVTDAQRQPGSAIKPFVYAAGLASGFHEEKPITLATTYTDAPKTFEEGYAPENFGGRYLERPVTVREALARSLNVITVNIAQDTGYGEVAGMIGRCGLPRPPANAATALGASEVTPLELASAYTVFIAGGRRVEPICLKQVADSDGRGIQRLTSQSEAGINPQVAYLVLSVLRDVITQPYGTGQAAASLGDFALAGKTGTSQRSDAWFVGLTPFMVSVAWVGFDDNRPLNATGSAAALPIWISFMRQAARLRPDLLAGDFRMPEGLVERPIDPGTGMLATQLCPEHRMELFLEGREVTEFCTEHPGPALEPPSEALPEVPEPTQLPNGSLGGAPKPRLNDNVTVEPPESRTEAEPRTRPRRVTGRPNVTQQRPEPIPPPNPQPQP